MNVERPFVNNRSSINVLRMAIDEKNVKEKNGKNTRNVYFGYRWGGIYWYFKD